MLLVELQSQKTHIKNLKQLTHYLNHLYSELMSINTLNNCYEKEPTHKKVKHVNFTQKEKPAGQQLPTLDTQTLLKYIYSSTLINLNTFKTPQHHMWFEQGYNFLVGLY